MALPNKEKLTPQEVADYFRVSKWTIYAWIRRGKLDATNPGGNAVRITKSSVRELEDVTDSE